ncbi:MAG: type IV secretion system DNA-binding domain-containing protein [Alphaproteobacteria bacterium]
MAQNTSMPLVAPTAQAVIARRRTGEGVTIAVLVFFIVSYCIAFLANQMLLQFNQGLGLHLNTHFALWLKSLAYAVSAGRAWPESVPAYWTWAKSQPDHHFAIIYFMSFFSASTAAGCAWWAGQHIAKPRDPHIHVRGRQLRRGEEARQYAQRASREKCTISRPELKIHDSIVLARHQVLQSVMVMGAQGGGKTQILWRILLPLIQKNWKTVIFDLAKGDYTISTPNVHRLFALGDARSSVWAIWRDVRTLADAESFARGLIIESADPMWSNAARGVVVAMLMRLINERGQDWRWRDLGETTFAGLPEIKQFAERHYPPAVASVFDEESKTTQSIHINLMAYLAPLYRFSLEWADVPENFTNGKPRTFSWIDWLNDDDSADRNIILQSNSKDKTSATALIRAMLEVQIAHIASLEFSESKTRSIFYMLDELPQAGRLSSLPTIMEVGRSKGCAVGLSFQDIAQTRQIYPRGEDDKWLALLGIRIFAQIKGGASAKFVIDQIGSREVERPTTSVTSSDGGYSVSNSYQRAELPVMTADELEKLGPQKNGVRAIVLGHSSDVLELTWPYYSPPERRKAKVAIGALRDVQTPATPAIAESEQEKNIAETPVPVHNTDEQVNGIEAKIETPAKAEAEAAAAAGFHDVETLDQSPASFDNAETPETRAAVEFEQVKDNAETYLDIPIFDIAETQNEPEKHEDEQESDSQVAVAEFADHFTSEAVGHAVGITPELVAVGFELLDEVAGGTNSGPAEVVKVMTPAQLRRLRKQQREAEKV